MSSELIVKPDSEIAKDTSGLLMAVKFQKNKKRNFDSVLALAKKADLFLEQDGQYLCGLSKTPAQAKLSMAILEEMRISSWKFILFANGRVQIKRYALRNMLDCFATASEMKDHRHHCHKTFDSPMANFAGDGAFTFKFEGGESAEEPKTWLLPCRKLEGFMSFSKDELTNPIPRIQATGVERLLSGCPYFDLSAFRETEKPKKIKGPKQYWD